MDTRLAPRTPATEIPPCPVCADLGPPRRLFGARDIATDRPGEFAVSRCMSCSMTYTAPRPTPESLGLFYEDVYSGDNANEMREMQTGPGMRVVLASRWGFVRQYVDAGPQTRLLDVGCGHGGFLKTVYERSGCQVHGCDTDTGSLEHGVAPAEAKLQAAELADAGYEDDSFDIVTLYHVLEHVLDPVAVLSEARRVLKPGGLLVVEVPNYGALWRRVFGRFWFPLLIPQHLSHFTRKTLGQALTRAGFGPAIAHRGCWAPFELIVSVGLLVKTALGGPPPPDRRPLWRWLGHKLMSLPMVVGFFLIDVPVSLLLARTPVSGHQVAVVRKN